jgi:hypothetical protein
MPQYVIYFKMDPANKKPKSKKIWAESVGQAESEARKKLPQNAIIIDVERQHDAPAESCVHSF